MEFCKRYPKIKLQLMSPTTNSIPVNITVKAAEVVPVAQASADKTSLPPTLTETGTNTPERITVPNKESVVAAGLNLFEITILSNDDNVVKVFKAPASSPVELDDRGVLNTF